MVAIVVFIFIGMCICCASKATAVPMYLAILGTLLPVIVFLIIYWLPKEADRPIVSLTDVSTDWGPVVFIIFWVLIFLFALIALLQLIVMYCFRMSTAYSLDTGGAGFTAAFIDNEEKDEDEEIGRAHV